MRVEAAGYGRLVVEEAVLRKLMQEVAGVQHRLREVAEELRILAAAVVEAERMSPLALRRRMLFSLLHCQPGICNSNQCSYPLYSSR